MNISSLIGKTKILRLRGIEEKFGLKSGIFAKPESFNPSGSVKDRAALFMIKSAFDEGLIDEKGRVIEATSGNMGISLAMLSAVFGYSALIVMPENMSPERQAFIKAYGGEVMLTSAHKGMAGAIERAERLALDVKNSYMPRQFTNRSNMLAHYKTTGPEIYSDMGGRVDIFICGVGTGGTLSGAGKYLKERIPSVRLIGVEPSESAVLSGGSAGSHGIQGIGAGFPPPLLNISLLDEVITVSTEDAMLCARQLACTEGIFAGISSGAALSAAISVAKREENKDKNIVILLPDGGEKYLSSFGD